MNGEKTKLIKPIEIETFGRVETFKYHVVNLNRKKKKDKKELRS